MRNLQTILTLATFTTACLLAMPAAAQTAPPNTPGNIPANTTSNTSGNTPANTPANIAQERAAGLRQQLADVEKKQGELQTRLRQLEEDSKSENIEKSLAGVGSTRPEDLREQRRRQMAVS